MAVTSIGWIVRRHTRSLWSLVAACVLGFPLAADAQLIISEFRVRGPNGANDEFVEIYNNSGANHTVAAISGTGYGLAASDGVTRCTIPNGTVIPNRGHYLCVNSVGYSLASYPAGNGTTATGDATYTTDIPDNAGLALFNNNTGGGSYILANRLDAVGSTSEANALYKEGAGYPALTSFSIDYSFTRRPPGGCTGSAGGANCNSVALIQTTSGPATYALVDTNNNAADFMFVDTNGTSAGAGQRLGAPGPENLSSPASVDGSSLALSALDSTRPYNVPPNYVRSGGAYCGPPNPIVPPCVPAQNSTFGTLDIRQRFTNNTGANITRLRFRVIDITTFPSISGVADLRPITSSDTVDVVIQCHRARHDVGAAAQSAERIRLQRHAVGRRDHPRARRWRQGRRSTCASCSESSKWGPPAFVSRPRRSRSQARRCSVSSSPTEGMVRESVGDFLELCRHRDSRNRYVAGPPRRTRRRLRLPESPTRWPGSRSR